MRVDVAGRRVDLTPTEFQLLVALTRQPGRVFTRASCSTRSTASHSSRTSARSTPTSRTSAARSSPTRTRRATCRPCSASATASRNRREPGAARRQAAAAGGRGRAMAAGRPSAGVRRPLVAVRRTVRSTGPCGAQGLRWPTAAGAAGSAGSGGFRRRMGCVLSSAASSPSAVRARWQSGVGATIGLVATPDRLHGSWPSPARAVAAPGHRLVARRHPVVRRDRWTISSMPRGASRRATSRPRVRARARRRAAARPRLQRHERATPGDRAPAARVPRGCHPRAADAALGHPGPAGGDPGRRLSGGRRAPSAHPRAGAHPQRADRGSADAHDSSRPALTLRRDRSTLPCSSTTPSRTRPRGRGGRPDRDFAGRRGPAAIDADPVRIRRS